MRLGAAIVISQLDGGVLGDSAVMRSKQGRRKKNNGALSMYNPFTNRLSRVHTDNIFTVAAAQSV